jgi:hypothetical protein
MLKIEEFKKDMAEEILARWAAEFGEDWAVINKMTDAEIQAELGSQDEDDVTVSDVRAIFGAIEELRGLIHAWGGV